MVVRRGQWSNGAVLVAIAAAMGGVSCSKSDSQGDTSGSGGDAAGDGDGDLGGANSGGSGAGGSGSGGLGGDASGGSGPMGANGCPVACDGPCWDGTCGSQVRPVPDTADAACLDDADGATCPSTGQARYGQDGNYPFDASEFVEGDAQVRVDAVTGLAWTVELSDEVTHAEALAHCAELAEDSFAGYDNWRLPTLRELYSTVQPADEFGQTTHENLEAPEPNSIVWSRNLVQGSDDVAWGVSGNWALSLDCATSGDEDYETHTARCVAGDPASGIWPTLEPTDEVVVAPSTGLEWQRALAGTGNWTYALATCEALVLDGKSDWRLPEARELASLLQQFPTDVLAGFPGFMSEDQAAGYWSSSPGSAYGAEVYYALPTGELDLAYTADLEFAVRCVRKT